VLSWTIFILEGCKYSTLEIRMSHHNYLDSLIWERPVYIEFECVRTEFSMQRGRQSSPEDSHYTAIQVGMW